MESVQQHAAEAIIPASVREKSPRPAEMMVKVEVETGCANLVIGGWTVPCGTSQVTVAVDQLARVEALVETRHDRIAQAQVNLEYAIKTAVAEGRAIETLPYSLQAEFRKLAPPYEKQRDMLPLTSCKVIGEPYIREADGAANQTAMMTAMADAVARAVAKALADERASTRKG